MRRRTKGFLPFGYKLMLSYAAFIILPLLLVAYTANTIFVSSIREQTRSNISGTLQQIRDNITYKLHDSVRLSDMLYFDSTFIYHLRNSGEGWASYEATTKQIVPKMLTALEMPSSKLWLSVYVHNTALPEIYHTYEYQDPMAAKNRMFDLYQIRRIAGSSWYLNYPLEKYGVTMQWKQIEDDGQYGRISLLRRIVDNSYPGTLQEVGFIRISAQLSDLLESIDYQKIGERTALFLTDEEGRVLTSTGTADIRPGQLWRSDTGGTSLVIQADLPEPQWRLIALVPPDITERDTQRLRNWTLLICAICFIVFSFAGAFISKYFSRRVSKIVSALEAFHEGNFEKRIHFKGNDEFTQISSALNEMGQNTGELIRKVYETNLRKKEADLASLQAQIHPHFLYNTLSSISRLAKFGKLDRVEQMVRDLAKFYRLALNEGRTLIPVRDEVEQAKAYLNIQKTKYGERMTVYYDIDPRILGYTTIKLILQPFLENVLKYAWLGDSIRMRVTGELADGKVIFKVIDDGIGIDPETVRQIQDPAGNTVGYGIRNVDERIRLYYGQEYGVSIYSRPGIGTAVRIVLPAVRNEEQTDPPAARLRSS